MTEDVRLGVESTEPHVGENSRPEEYQPNEEYRPSEWESAFLSIALFGGLILFGIGCVLFGWT